MHENMHFFYETKRVIALKQRVRIPTQYEVLRQILQVTHFQSLL